MRHVVFSKHITASTCMMLLDVRTDSRRPLPPRADSERGRGNAFATGVGSPLTFTHIDNEHD